MLEEKKTTKLNKPITLKFGEHDRYILKFRNILTQATKFRGEFKSIFVKKFDGVRLTRHLDTSDKIKGAQHAHFKVQGIC